jgi:hypothetical protein
VEAEEALARLRVSDEFMQIIVGVYFVHSIERAEGRVST